MSSSDFGPAVGDRSRGQIRREWPLDRDGISLHCGEFTAIGNSERLAVDPRFELPVDGIDEVVAMELRMKAEDAAAEQAVEQLLAPRTDRKCFWIWPRNVPEGDDRRGGQRLPHHPR